jgi:Flp pilus assembly protein TadD
MAADLETGRNLHQQGRLTEAQRIYIEVLSREPDNAEALHLMGVLAIQGRQPVAAVHLLSKAISREANSAGMYSTRAVAFAALGRFEEALADHDRVIALQPASADAHNLRGDCLHVLQRRDEALASYQRAVELNPDHAAAHLGRADVLNEQGRHEAAAESYAAAVALNPANPIAHFNRGNVLRLLQRVDEAIASYDRAIALKPDFAVAHHNRAFCLLQKGDLDAGFREYEWRRKCPTFDDPRYALERPWNGEQDLSGKTLFIFPELFLGDMLQFCRFAVTAERRGARVMLAAPASMHELLRSLSPTIELLPEHAVPPGFDYQAALMSLPGAFGATLATLPVEAAYLRPDPARVERWKARIGGEGFKIGVVWQGSTLPYALPLQRSYPLAALQHLARLPGVRLISLQKHNGLEQLASLPDGMMVESLGDDFDPGPQAFVDTAAAMACCDLVIAMDTSAAHLAGAIGARTWVALPYVADWRWLIDRSDSPWYPSMRLFRQSTRGDWGAVFARMETALKAELGV